MQPEVSNQEERAAVVDVLLTYWALGDFKFLYQDEWQHFGSGLTHDMFLNKWADYIRWTSSELEDLVGENLFGDSWEEK